MEYLAAKTKELTELMLLNGIVLIVASDGVEIECFTAMDLLKSALGKRVDVTSNGADYISNIDEEWDAIEIIRDVRYMVLTVGIDG